MPLTEGQPMWAGPGWGETCTACDRPIERHHALIEWEWPERGTIHLHQSCYRLWRRLRGDIGIALGPARRTLFGGTGFLCATCLAAKAGDAPSGDSSAVEAPGVFEIRVLPCAGCGDCKAVIAFRFRQPRDASGTLLCLECNTPIPEGAGVALVHLTGLAKIHIDCLASFRRHRVESIEG